jgi:uncharacterized SAM-binding protein YcdF (DUF218 family)
MFYFLSKTIYLLVMPVTWVFILLLLALFNKSPKKKNTFLIIGIATLYIFSCPFFANFLMKSWEVPAKPFSAYSENYQTAIVLGGVTDVNKLPRDRVFTKQGADRILHAAKLYDLGIVKNVLVTGGTFSDDPGAISEAFQMKKVLLQCGIPDTVIMVEGASLNTRENALKSTELLEKKGIAKDQHILVTSAFHMRRATGCFNQVGLNVTAFSTDFYTSDGTLGVSFLEHVYPTEESFYKTFRVFREVLGFIVYKALSYA